MNNVIEALPRGRRTPFDVPTPAQREAFLHGLTVLQETMRRPRHVPTVMVHQRVRNREVLYAPINDLARAFADIGKRPDKMLTAADLAVIEGKIGCNVEFVARRP